MNFIFASDSFKGSLSSMEINSILEKSAKKHFKGVKISKIAIADGGEGTLDAFLSAKGGARVPVSVKDPLFRDISADYANIGDRAVICMAEASGLTLLDESEKDPLKTTTHGTGELIKAAMEAGHRDIIIAIGGSATNDGGIGAMIALGVKFFDAEGKELRGVGADLVRITRIDTSEISPLIKKTKFTVMCDVENPLCGENGATYTYGRQKGGTDQILDDLEAGMKNYARLLKSEFGADPNTVVGGGAAGGLGAALKLFLGAEMRSGIDLMLEVSDFESKIENCDFVFSGEGRIDGQSAFGKVIYGIGKRCKLHKKPLICVAGSIGDGAEKLRDIGVCAMFSIANSPMTLEYAIENAAELLAAAADNIFVLIRSAGVN